MQVKHSLPNGVLQKVLPQCEVYKHSKTHSGDVFLKDSSGEALTLLLPHPPHVLGGDPFEMEITVQSPRYYYIPIVYLIS